MKRTSFFIIFIVIILLSPSMLFSQALTDTITVDLQLFVPDAGILFLNDLGLTNVGSAPLVFAVTIQSYFLTDPKDIILSFGIRRGSESIVEGTSKPFPIQPMEMKYLTNHTLLTEGNEYSLQNVDITNAADELKDAILSSGKLPAGLYQFYVEINYQKNDINQKIAIDQEEINISAPTLLDLVSPGQPTDNPDLPELYTTMPFFQWESNATEFEITVCEKLATNVSPSDVMDNEPRVQQIVNDVTFFQYPSDAWELEEEKTYYWQVVAIIQSSGGEVRLESEIWGFKIANISGGTFSVEHEMLLSTLTSLFGNTLIENLFKEGGELDGYSFTGVMKKNGVQMSLDDLNALLSKISNNEIKLKSHSIE